ncbi:phospholipid-binding protein MlaC [Rickettsiella endosymbiont of Litargus connexus]|uniref:MlaC/ttg2D family ABC transporter substrate-binding protein n=1 Tax=Rickettsiella endosymbiont of Litargus connexus TaxID=3066237 RepID=UPI00376F452C|nr:ABC transporter substrate-binding protein [Candidatus Rickettsiella isopodorum]MDD5161474.1 ABC transporter substrate-binding protein [Candidatus Rickettsiella isopodorum]
MKKIIFVFFGLLICTMAWAISSPVDLLQSTSNQLISALQRNQATLKTKPQIVYGIVNQILLPHVDVMSMSSKALGREAWLRAMPMQRQAFAQQFVTLLIRTYSSALAQYTNERVNFLPLRGDYNSESRVQVNSVIVRETGPSINLSYRLMRVNGQWMLYDFSVGGVSIIESFRSQFAQELQNNGIDGLINKLAQHNNQNY